MRLSHHLNNPNTRGNNQETTQEWKGWGVGKPVWKGPVLITQWWTEGYILTGSLTVTWMPAYWLCFFLLLGFLPFKLLTCLWLWSYKLVTWAQVSLSGTAQLQPTTWAWSMPVICGDPTNPRLASNRRAAVSLSRQADPDGPTNGPVQKAADSGLCASRFQSCI